VSTNGNGGSSAGEQHLDIVHHMPAVRFICKPDFFSILHMNQVICVLYEIGELMNLAAKVH
jgi:hypothetical protein